MKMLSPSVKILSESRSNGHSSGKNG